MRHPDHELGWSFFVSPSETKDTLARVKRAADALAVDMATHAELLPLSEFDAFRAWWDGLTAFYDASIDMPFWKYGAGTQDSAERYLAEVSEWRARFLALTSIAPTGTDPGAALSLPEQGVPGGLSELAGVLKWGAIGLGVWVGYRIVREFR
jgi:hypothetical protein